MDIKFNYQLFFEVIGVVKEYIEDGLAKDMRLLTFIF